MEQAIDTVQRLSRRAQLQALDLNAILSSHLKSQIDVRPIPNKWSFNEHLLHLTRYAYHFTHRLAAMKEGASQLDRYIENEDATWQEDCTLRTTTSLDNYGVARQVVLAQLNVQSNWSLKAAHPVMGTLSFLEWVEFFLQHEGHHIYTLFRMSKMQINKDG